MLAEEYLSFKNTLAEKGIIFSFSGYVSEGILFALGDALKQKMALAETDLSTTKRVFSIFVEQVQNVIRYSAERVSGDIGKPVELSSGMIAVGNDGKRFFVICANKVLLTDMERLRDRLQHLQGLDKDEIKAYYKEKLREDPEVDSKGASIGLIEIARRSSAPIDFDFVNVSDSHAFFCLKAFI
ncbi:MAG TPA: SiaB family protein kinase [Patescibacteria group bacterium]|nr:SiaB family protein kinase [Patescibacteria group bacterium]